MSIEATLHHGPQMPSPGTLHDHLTGTHERRSGSSVLLHRLRHRCHRHILEQIRDTWNVPPITAADASADPGTLDRTCSTGRAIAPCHPTAIKPSVAGSIIHRAR